MEPACLPVFPENPANFVSYEKEAESDGYMPESSCSDTGYDESDLNGEDWAKIARNKG